MAKYRPSAPFIIPMWLLNPNGPSRTTTTYGVFALDYPSEPYAEGQYCKRINVSFRTFGGTETTTNGIYDCEDTAIVETWYDPDIKSDSRLAFCNGDSKNVVFEVIGSPEDIEMRHQLMKFKVRRVRGRA